MLAGARLAVRRRLGGLLQGGGHRVAHGASSLLLLASQTHNAAPWWGVWLPIGLSSPSQN